MEEYIKRFTTPAGEAIASSKQAADHFRGYYTQAAIDKELFVVAFLNGQNQIIATEILFTGSIASAAVYPREVIVSILKHKAVAIIISHNHPSGTIKASSQDRAITAKIKHAVETIDARLLDHIIIGGGEYLSFTDSGYL